MDSPQQPAKQRSRKPQQMDDNTTLRQYYIVSNHHCNTLHTGRSCNVRVRSDLSPFLSHLEVIYFNMFGSVLTFVFEFVSEDTHTTVTSAKEVMFYTVFVCLSVCLLVTEVKILIGLS